MASNDDHHQMAGYSITGSLWAFGPKLNEKAYEALATSLPFESSCVAGVSQLVVPSSNKALRTGLQAGEHTQEEALLVMRLLSNNPEKARSVCEQTRAFLRPLIMKSAGSSLRIWAT
jgi:urease accessory protein UreH